MGRRNSEFAPQRFIERQLVVSQGFTLMELIIAMGILVILAGTVILSLDPFAQFGKAADSKRKSDLAQIQRALEAFYQDFGRYPENTVPNYTIDSDVDPSVEVERAWGSSWPPYIDILPQDSAPSKSYVYISGASGQSYFLYASLDRASLDSDTCNEGASCDGASGISCGQSGNVCNYGVSSPNVSP